MPDGRLARLNPHRSARTAEHAEAQNSVSGVALNASGVREITDRDVLAAAHLQAVALYDLCVRAAVACKLPSSTNVRRPAIAE